MTDQTAEATPGDGINLTLQSLTAEDHAAMHPTHPDPEVEDGINRILNRARDAYAPPRRVPTMAERITDTRRCHTPEQHRHDDGQNADDRSKDRAIQALEAELAAARDPRPELTELLERMTAERDTAQQTATFRQGVIDRHREEVFAAGQAIAAQAAQLRANGTLLCRLRDLDEQRDRAWAEHDTVGEPAPRHPGDALADALRNAYSTEQLAGLHEELVHALDDDAPREHPLGRLVDALFSARWHKPPTGSVNLGDRIRLIHPAPNGCDDCSVESGERHRYADCPGNRRAAAHADAPLGSVSPHAQDDPEGAEQVLRDRLEHAIRARLGKAWPQVDDAGPNWLDQVAAVAAVAAVNELRQP